MKRRALLMAILAAAAAFPLGADLAHAQGRGQGGGHREQRAWDRGGHAERRQWERREQGDRGNWSYPRDRFDRPHSFDDGPRRGRRDDGGDGRRRYQRSDRRQPEPAYRPPRQPPTAMRRGGYLPPAYRGGFVYDYQRYRLRPPPHGYAWVRVGGGFALVSVADGQIFDLVQ